MKKGGLFLLTLLFLTYGYQGYKILQSYKNDVVKIKTSGLLSDIANDVMPVPLETPDSGVVRQVKRVQRDGNNIFLISDSRLLHFDISGSFINQPAIGISDNEDLFITDYALDMDYHHIIVIDSQRNISKYDYSGNLISITKISHPWLRITACAYHSGCLWVSAESVEKKSDNYSFQMFNAYFQASTETLENASLDSYHIAHRLYQFDGEMNEISIRRFYPAEIGRDVTFNTLCIDELLADEDGVYAYSSPVDMTHLLNDTLHFLHYKNIAFTFDDKHQHEAPVYPIRKSKRYIMSTSNSIDGSYTFCYDKTNNNAFLLNEGFNDDFYNTGLIADLQPVDIHNSSYCYLKSETDKPVLFIVTLKS